MYNNSFFQRLIFEAYELLEENEDWNYEKFINALDEKHKAAVLVGDLNYQVRKGGFDWWDWDKYSIKADDLLKILNEFVEDTRSVVGKEVIALIEIYTKEVRYLFCSNYTARERLLTKIYLKINKYFLEEFDEWLIKKYGNAEEKQETV